MAIWFSIAEIIGSILGYGLLMLLTPNEILPSEGICMTIIHPGMSITEGFVLEFVLTSALISVICGVWDPRNRKFLDSAPLRIGET